MLKKVALTILGGLALVQFAHAGLFSFDGVLDASQDVAKAATMSDSEIKSEALRARACLDKANKIAPPSSPYAKRLAKLTKGMKTDCTQKLDIKVYLVKDVNAFAMADGTVRVYSALMDKMTDDEVRYVIGHEVGHVTLGHSKKKFQMAHAASAARKVGAASTNKVASALTDSALGDFAVNLVNAQFSQSEESAADKFALNVMKKNNYDPKSAVSALRKLEKMFGNEKSIFSSHPAPGDRADDLEKLL
jgi:metalloprotease